MKSRRYWCLLIFSSIYISYVFSQKNVSSSSNVDGPKIRCYNGTIRAGKCYCNPDYFGDMCERKMNCLGYDRKDSIYCTKCREGWKGERCDEIDCGKGGKQVTFDECLCNEPYSGKFCKELLTEDINLSYNRAIVNAMGPIGIFLVIPMILIVIGCRKLSEKKIAKRVEKALEEQHNRDLDSKEVAKLLK